VHTNPDRPSSNRTLSQAFPLPTQRRVHCYRSAADKVCRPTRWWRRPPGSALRKDRRAAFCSEQGLVLVLLDATGIAV
jgi:hypothetical protein